MKSIVFSNRTIKEIMRDPLSYIFCLGFPIVMLIIMSIVDSSIPAQANMTVFHIENLGPGIAFFGLTFIMLFISIQVSKDRSTAVLLRLYASPMKARDYIIGYTLPAFILGFIQMIICFIGAFIIGIITGYNFSIVDIIISIIAMIPSMLLFVGIGILFGTVVNEKAAPGICSIVITVTGMIGGIWMDVDGLGGTIKKVAEVLPFYHGVKLAKVPFQTGNEEVMEHLIWIISCAVVVYVLAIVVFSKKMKKDIS